MWRLRTLLLPDPGEGVPQDMDVRRRHLQAVGVAARPEDVVADDDATRPRRLAHDLEAALEAVLADVDPREPVVLEEDVAANDLFRSYDGVAAKQAVGDRQIV